MKENIYNRIKELATNRQTAWELYCSLCNQIWIDKQYDENLFIKKEKEKYSNPIVVDNEYENVLSFSWRGAGGFISDCVDENPDYLNFYCCRFEGEVGEGAVTEIAANIWDLLGYKLVVDYYERFGISHT